MSKKARKRTRREFGAIRQLPSKRYQATYWGPDKQQYFGPGAYKSQGDAEAWLNAERKLIESNNWTPPKFRREKRNTDQTTLSDYAQQWIAQRKLTERTREGYESKKRLFIDPTIGTYGLREITREIVREWYAGLGSKYPTRNAHAYSLLHAIFETAVDDDLIGSNPCRIRGAMNAPKRRATVLLSVDEIDKLADAIAPERFRALIQIAAWCGLRWGEIVELRRKDVASDAASITVTRAATHRNGHCYIGLVKEKHIKTIGVPPHIRADIKHHLDVFVANDPDAQLFPATRGGCHLNDRVFRGSYYADALASIKRSDATFHDLRHFAGTTVARAGATPKETQMFLGHHTPKAADIYQHVADDWRDRVAERVSAFRDAERAKTAEATR